MKLFLDSNVLLDYLLDSRGEFHAPAVELMLSIAAGDHEAGFSTSQATDIYYSLKKACGDGTARDALRSLFELCGLFATSPRACADALESPMRDYEDAVQVATAVEAGCDYIITRDARDYTNAGVPHIDPKGFFDLGDVLSRR